MPPDETRRDADLAAIDRLHQADMRAVLAGDTATLTSLWTDDIVAIAPGAPIREGRQANAESLRRMSEASADWAPVEYALDFRPPDLIGDHAVEWGTFRGRSRHRVTGEEATTSGTVMRVLRRQADGSWRVARTMFTVE